MVCELRGEVRARCVTRKTREEERTPPKGRPFFQLRGGIGEKGGCLGEQPSNRSGTSEDRATANKRSPGYRNGWEALKQLL